MAGYSYNGIDYDENGNPISNEADPGQYAQPGATTNTGAAPTYGGMSQADFLAAYRAALAGGMSEEDAINSVKAQNGGMLAGGDAGGWGSYGPGANNAPPVSTTGGAAQSASTTTGGGAGFGGGFGGGGSLIDPFTQPFNAPSPVNLGGPAGIPYIPPTPNYKAPTFTPPSYKPPPAWSYDPYTALDKNSVQNEPGYAFGMDQGEQALLNAKAAQGIAGTGATLKAILGWGGDYATGRYNDAEARNERIYGANRQNSKDIYDSAYQTQTLDPYRFAYQGAMDAFAPQMAEFNANVGAGNLGYSTQAAAGQRQNEANYNNAWEQMLFDYDKFKDQRDSTFSKQYAVLGL